jgi:hypothetical protein
VGKKPPQSHKGGFHGLTPRTFVGLRRKEEILFYFKTNFVFFVFLGRRRPRGAPQGHLRPGGKPKKKNIFF